MKPTLVERFILITRTGYFRPKTWAFWRSVICCLVLGCFIGHAMEVPYCHAMDALFGIVEDDYAVFIDPWYVPYWVYGWGAFFMTLFLEPFKEHILRRRKTVWGALLEMFILMIIISCVLELVFGLICNQPDANGVYPYWDNSQLPGNVFGQAWLVNDFFIGLFAMVYLWLIFPLVATALKMMSPKVANAVCVALVLLLIGAWMQTVILYDNM